MAALSNGVYTIVNQKSGTYLAIPPYGGVNVIGDAPNDESYQKWNVLERDGLFHIRNLLNGRFLSFTRGFAGISDGVPVVGNSQEEFFRMELDSGNSGGYRIIVPDTSQCITLSDHGNSAPGTRVELWENCGFTNQIWRFEKV
ncbi:hypothetical protein N7499_001895 [Penicillium canescens]|nr:hypothetical protein N7499_001895 [Penicillium canescens]KAJ6165511.1 hypothetical protein N7485_008755 [Penicillium canescens]